LDIAQRSRLRLAGTTTLGSAASVIGGELEVTTNGSLTVPATATYDIATTFLTGSGLLTLDGDRTMPTLGIFGGTLSGTGTRTVTGAATLDSGTLSGNGRTAIASGGSLTIGTGQGGTLAIGGGHVLVIDAGATATWGPGPHDIQLDAPSRLEVAGELLVTNDRVLRGSGTLAVTGTLRKSSHGVTSIQLADAAASPLALTGSVEVRAGLLDIAGPGLDVVGTASVGATSSETGTVRTTTLRLAPEGTLRIGIAGTTPAARSGSIVVTGAPPDLGGTIAVVPDAAFTAPAPQVLVLVASPGEPTGTPTITGADTLPGSPPGSVEVEATGVVLRFGPDG
jgi:hypothetical protein